MLEHVANIPKANPIQNSIESLPMDNDSKPTITEQQISDTSSLGGFEQSFDDMFLLDFAINGSAYPTDMMQYVSTTGHDQVLPTDFDLETMLHTGAVNVPTDQFIQQQHLHHHHQKDMLHHGGSLVEDILCQQGLGSEEEAGGGMHPFFHLQEQYGGGVFDLHAAAAAADHYGFLSDMITDSEGLLLSEFASSGSEADLFQGVSLHNESDRAPANGKGTAKPSSREAFLMQEDVYKEDPSDEDIRMDEGQSGAPRRRTTRRTAGSSSRTATARRLSSSFSMSSTSSSSSSTSPSSSLSSSPSSVSGVGKKEKSSGTAAARPRTAKVKHCSNCRTSETTMWRRAGPTGKDLMCNRYVA